MPNRLDFEIAYRRNLPHIQPPGATLFITTRLYGSLPTEALQRLYEEAQLRLAAIDATDAPAERAELRYREEKRYFARFDQLLDRADHGPNWLQNATVAQIIVDALHNRDGQTYDLIAYCVMPNHLHLVLTPLPRDANSYFSMSRIMHVLKGFTAYRANDALGRKGTFWQAESYDHYVRDQDELQRVVYYVIFNPVKAGLVEDWSMWPWTYWKFAPAP